MLTTTPFPKSTKQPNEITIKRIGSVYKIIVPRGMYCEQGYRWCYDNLPAHTWIQYRNYIDKLDINGYVGISWDSMTFEIQDPELAVEFALRFS